MRTSEQLDQLATALAAAQSKFPVPPKTKSAEVQTKTGGKYEYSYADLGDIVECIRPVMAEFGLAAVQMPSYGPAGLTLDTMLLHKSGQFIEGSVPIPTGLKPQELGSWLTYMKRYSLTGGTRVVAEDDDDGQMAQNAGSSNKSAGTRKPPVAPNQASPGTGPKDAADKAKMQKRVTEAQLKRLHAIIAARLEAGWDKHTVESTAAVAFNITETLAELSMLQYDKLVAWIEKSTFKETSEKLAKWKAEQAGKAGAA